MYTDKKHFNSQHIKKGAAMPEHSKNASFSFSLGGYNFHISNIAYGQFNHAIPSHSHSKNSYEIHYISSGYGETWINGKNTKSYPASFMSPVPVLNTPRFRIPTTPCANTASI